MANRLQMLLRRQRDRLPGQNRQRNTCVYNLVYVGVGHQSFESLRHDVSDKAEVQGRSFLGFNWD